MSTSSRAKRVLLRSENFDRNIEGQCTGAAAPNRRRPSGEPAGFQSRCGAGPEIAGRRRRARPPPLELRSGRLAPPPRIQQNLPECRYRVDSAPKTMHRIQEVARRRFAKQPTWTRLAIGTQRLVSETRPRLCNMLCGFDKNGGMSA